MYRLLFILLLLPSIALADRAALNISGFTGGALTQSGNNFTFAGELRLADGTSADPSLTFSAETGTGFARAAAGRMDAVVLGESQLRFTDGALLPNVDSNVDLGSSARYFKDAYIDSITTTGRLLTPEGLVGTPAIAPSGDTDSGIYFQNSAGRTNIAAAGVRMAYFDTVGATLNGETAIVGISADGTGKVACVKSDGKIGSCSTTVAAGGTCTCG